MSNNDILHIIHTDLRYKDIAKAATQIRKQNYLEQCAEHSIKFMIHPGVTGALQIFHNINAAHKNVIRYAKENLLPYIHIAEDDFVFTGKGAWKYYLDNKPQSFDMYMAVIYAGTVENQKVLSAFSGGMSVYTVSEKFYDFILNAPANEHLDRLIGTVANQYDLLVPPKYCVRQLGGYSFNFDRSFNYSGFEEGKEFFTG